MVTTQRSDRPNTRRDLLLVAATLVAAIAVYYVAMGRFALWYATDSTSDSTPLHEPLFRTWSGLMGIWAGELPLADRHHYRPVSHTVYWAAYQLWGSAEAGYHLLSLGLHLASAFMAVKVLRRLGIPGAAWCGVVFALHPIAVQTVVWPANIKILVATLFYLVALDAAVRFRSSQRYSTGIWMTVFVGLACLAKTSAMSFPALIALLALAAGWKTISRRELLVFVACAVVVGGITLVDWVFAARASEGPAVPFPLHDRLVLTGVALARSLRNALIPYPLMLNYPFALSIPDLLVSACLLTGGILLLAMRRTWALRNYLMVLSAFCIGMAPYWIVLTATWKATPAHDRYQYLPTLILWAGVSYMLFMGRRSSATRVRIAATIAVAVVTVIFPLLTWRQATLYAGDTDMGEFELTVHPASRMSRMDLLPVYALRQDWSAVARTSEELLGIDHWQDRVNIRRSEIYRGLMTAHLSAQRDDLAVASLRRAIQEYDPDEFLGASQTLHLAAVTLESSDPRLRDPVIASRLLSSLREREDELSADEVLRLRTLSATETANHPK